MLSGLWARRSQSEGMSVRHHPERPQEKSWGRSALSG